MTKGKHTSTADLDMRDRFGLAPGETHKAEQPQDIDYKKRCDDLEWANKSLSTQLQEHSDALQSREIPVQPTEDTVERVATAMSAVYEDFWKERGIKGDQDWEAYIPLAKAAIAAMRAADIDVGHKLSEISIDGLENHIRTALFYLEGKECSLETEQECKELAITTLKTSLAKIELSHEQMRESQGEISDYQNIGFAIDAAILALSHSVPEDCYSTGPLHGDARDSLCIACNAINQFEALREPERESGERRSGKSRLTGRPLDENGGIDFQIAPKTQEGLAHDISTVLSKHFEYYEGNIDDLTVLLCEAVESYLNRP